MRHHKVKAFLSLLGGFVVLTVSASACGDGAPMATVTQTASPERVTQTVGQDGGTVSVGDEIVVRIPAGALQSDTTISITLATEVERAPGELEAAKSIGPAFKIDLGGQELSGPVVLEIAFDPDLLPEDSPADAVFLAFYDEDKSQWVPVYGTVDLARHVVVVETDHLSWWNPFSWDLSELRVKISRRLEGLLDFVGLPVAEIPQCTSAPTYMTVEFSDSLLACIEGRETEGQAVLKLVNNRAYGTLVHLRPGVELDAVSHGSLSDAAWQLLVDRLGDDVVYIPPAGEAEFLLRFEEEGEISLSSVPSDMTLALDVLLIIPSVLGVDPDNVVDGLKCLFEIMTPEQREPPTFGDLLDVASECVGVVLKGTAGLAWTAIKGAVTLGAAVGELLVQRTQELFGGDEGKVTVTYSPSLAQEPTTPEPPTQEPPTREPPTEQPPTQEPPTPEEEASGERLELLWTYEIDDFIVDLSISADGSYLALSTEKRGIYFFDRSGKLLWSQVDGLLARQWLALSDDGSYLAVFDPQGNRIALFDRSGNLLWHHGLPTGRGRGYTPRTIGDVVVSTTGRVAALGVNDLAADYAVYYYDPSGELLWSYSLDDRYTYEPDIEVAMSSDGSYIAATRASPASYRGTAYNRYWLELLDSSGNVLWSHETPELTTVGEDTGTLSLSLIDLAISHDGSYIAGVLAGYRREIFVLDRSGQFVWNYIDENEEVDPHSLVISNGGSNVAGLGNVFLVGGGLIWGGPRNVYFVGSGTLLWSWSGPGDPTLVENWRPDRLSMSSDGSLLAIGAGYNVPLPEYPDSLPYGESIYLIDRSGEFLWTLDIPWRWGGGMESLDFYAGERVAGFALSSDGSYFALVLSPSKELSNLSLYHIDKLR